MPEDDMKTAPTCSGFYLIWFCPADKSYLPWPLRRHCVFCPMASVCHLLISVHDTAFPTVIISWSFTKRIMWSSIRCFCCWNAYIRLFEHRWFITLIIPFEKSYIRLTAPDVKISCPHPEWSRFDLMYSSVSSLVRWGRVQYISMRCLTAAYLFSLSFSS